MPAATDTPSPSPVASARPPSSNFTRSAILNLLGEGVPMVVSIISLRLLVHHLHEERFTILTLAWAVMAYFSIADLGISRALTQSVARRLGKGETHDASRLLYTGMLAIPLLGLAGMLLFLLLTPWMVAWLRVPAALAAEARTTFYVLALSLPLLVTTAGLRAILEACGRFGLLAAVKCTTGTLVLLVPLLLLPFTVYTPAIVGAAVAVRAAGLLLHAAACWRVLHPILHRPTIDRAAAAELFRFGRWLTLDNLLTPALVYGDRWLLPRLTTFGDVAFYATPLDLMLRLLFIPFAIAAVLFPTLALDLAGDDIRARTTMDRGARLLAAMLFPVTLILAALAPELMSIWLGPAWGGQSAQVLQLAAVALFVSGMSVVPGALVQAAGRPDLSFLLHCVDIPVQWTLVWLLVPQWGIVSAAAALVVRVTLDFLVHALLAHHLTRTAHNDHTLTRLIVGTFAGVATLILLSRLPSLSSRAAVLAIVLPCFAMFAWRKLIHREEAAWIWSRFRRRPAVPSPAVEGGVA